MPKGFKFKLFIIAIVIQIYCADCLLFHHLNISENTDDISSAIVVAIDKIFIKNSEPFDFLVYGRVTSHISSVISGILRKSNAVFTHTIKYKRTVEDFNFYQSAVILFEEMKSVNTINYLARLKSYIIPRFKFLIYCEDSNITKLALPTYDFNYFLKGNFFLHEYLIVKRTTFVEMITIRFFTPLGCNKRKLMLIDVFNEKTNKWKYNLKKIENNKNFHRCQITFQFGFSPYFYFKSSELNRFVMTYKGENFDEILNGFFDNNNIEFDGLFYEIVQTMSAVANFTPHYQLTIENQPVGREGSIRKNYFTISHIFTPNNRFIPSTPFIEHKSHFIITPREKYTNYEMLFFPFDSTTWMLLSFTFLLVFGAIFIINQTSRQIRDTIYGVSIRMPAYNAAEVFFGMANTRLPAEMFTRTILILFIFFCLIIRTAYQGVMFDLMTSDLRKPLPKIFDELKALNYKIVVQNMQSEKINLSAMYMKEMQIYDVKAVAEKDFHDYFCDNIDNDTIRNAFILMDIEMHELKFLCNRASFIELEKTKTVINRAYLWTPYRNCFISQVLNDVANKLYPSGIQNYHYDLGIWRIRRQPNSMVIDKRKILAFHDLEHGFTIWLAACGISTAVFVCELHALYLKRQMRKLIGLFYFIRLICMRMTVYHA